MIGSEKVRAARKEMQLARLKEKEENPEGYAEYFANLPKQVAKAKVNETIRVARQELRDATEALLIAQETGEGLLRAEEALQVATMYVAKLEEAKKISPIISLTAQGVAA